MEREHQHNSQQSQSAAHSEEGLQTGKSLLPPALQFSAESIPPDPGISPSSWIPVQPSLKIGAQSDVYEREADAVATQLVGRKGILPRVSRLPASFPSSAQRKAQRQGAVDMAGQLSASRSGGRVLDRSMRTEMEASFGHDFSNVRLHTDTPAVQMSQAIGAHAFTQGNHIYFNHGTYRPEQQAGKQLLAHELTHVVQQGAAQRKDPDCAASTTVLGQHKTVNVQRRETPNTLRRHAGGAEPTQVPIFEPETGTKTTNLENHYGKFKIRHGLVSQPGGPMGWGTYLFELEMEPKRSTGTSKIGFVQTVRRGVTPGNWGRKASDPGMSARKAALTTRKGWRMDSWDQPFYGTKKSGDEYMPGIASLNYVGAGRQKITRYGKYGGQTAYLLDIPSVYDPSVYQFTTTAMDMDSGTRFGSIAWGYHYGTGTSTWKEETPKFLRKSDRRMRESTEAMEHWNKNVASESGGTGAVPGV